MYGFVASLFAETASFRDPGGQLFHSCLPLPPVSTIVGIAGAVMGKSFADTWLFFKENHMAVGVRGRTGGQGKDLWRYTKITNHMEYKTDIVNREFLFKPQIELYYSAEDMCVVQKMFEAFQDPRFAISLGNSDEIAKLERLDTPAEIRKIESIRLQNTLIEGDLSKQVQFDLEQVKRDQIKVRLNAPVIRNLPVDFVFSNNGVRKANKFKVFTFFSMLQVLINPLTAYDFGNDQVVPLIFI